MKTTQHRCASLFCTCPWMTTEMQVRLQTHSDEWENLKTQDPWIMRRKCIPIVGGQSRLSQQCKVWWEGTLFTCINWACAPRKKWSLLSWGLESNQGAGRGNRGPHLWHHHRAGPEASGHNWRSHGDSSQARRNQHVRENYRAAEGPSRQQVSLRWEEEPKDLGSREMEERGRGEAATGGLLSSQFSLESVLCVLLANVGRF